MVLLVISASSQSKLKLKGTILDGKEKLPLPGATIMLTNLSDSIKSDGTITGLDGKFEIEVPKGKYIFTASFLGFNKYQDTLLIKDVASLDTIQLFEEKSMLEEINVVSTLAPTFQRGDTTQYNPDAFKVNLDATAGDLLMKMPGFYSVDGKLLAMGDTIKEVLMDGKKFFGNNISQALNMIPPKIIKKIEVYQYKSDGTKHSGFEESTEGKTVNIVTNLDTNAFVKTDLAAGVGKEERYAGKANYNRFMESNHFNANAEKNNINVPLRINRGSGQNSISGDEMKNNNINANFGLRGDTDFSVNYSFNNSESGTVSSSNREYLTGSLIGQKLYNQNSSQSASDNHSGGLRWSSRKNPKYYFSSSFQFSTSTSDSDNESSSRTLLNEDLINSSSNNSLTNNSSLSASGDVNFTRKLNQKGRSISTQLKYSYRSNQGDRKQLSETINSNGSTSQNINQISDNETLNNDITLGLSYNEKIGKKGHLSLGYRYRNYVQESDKETFDFDENIQEYSELDSLTSNNFENKSSVHVGKLGYRNEHGKFKTYAGIDFTNTHMENKELFPDESMFKEEFTTISPQIKLSYNSKKHKRFSLNYGMNQQIPSVSNLQDIVDNTNPLYISTGNPNLKLASRHSISFAMFRSNVKKSTFTTIQMKASLTNNMVAQNRVVAQNDTTVLGSYFLPAGGQFSQPVNLDGQFSLGIDGTFSFPLKKLKSKLNSRTGINFSRTPNILNNIKNEASRINVSQNFTLASNINEKIDFTINSNTDYSVVENTTSTTNQSGYFTQRTAVNLYWNFYKKFIFKTNTSQRYTGPSGTLEGNNRWFVNLSLSKKLFKDNKGEIAVSAYDIANNQNDVNRSVDDLYISESYRRTLNNFYMVSFSYKL